MIPIYEVKIISGNRITLPSQILKNLNIKLGDTLVVVYRGGHWILTTEDKVDVSVNYIL